MISGPAGPVGSVHHASQLSINLEEEGKGEHELGGTTMISLIWNLSIFSRKDSSSKRRMTTATSPAFKTVVWATVQGERLA